LCPRRPAFFAMKGGTCPSPGQSPVRYWDEPVVAVAVEVNGRRTWRRRGSVTAVKAFHWKVAEPVLPSRVVAWTTKGVWGEDDSPRGRESAGRPARAGWPSRGW